MNPFAILGLNTTVLLGIPDEDVQILLQSSFKALSRLHHPDMGGNPRVFKLIKEAYESLKDDEYRAEMLTQYLLPKSDRLFEAEAEVGRLESAFDHLVQELITAKSHKLDEYARSHKLDEYASPEFSQGNAITTSEVTLIVRANAHFAEEVDRDYVVVRASSEGVFISKLELDDVLPDGWVPDFAKSLNGSCWGYATEYLDDFYMPGYWYKNDMTTKVSRAEVPEQVGYRFYEIPYLQSEGTLIGSIPAGDLPEQSGTDQLSDLKALPVGLPTLPKSKDLYRHREGRLFDQGFSFASKKYYLSNLSFGFEPNRYLVAAENFDYGMRYVVLGQIFQYIELPGEFQEEWYPRHENLERTPRPKRRK